MEIIIHRVNNIERLRSIPRAYGCEIDIRASGSELILNHEAFGGGERLVDYLDEYQHGIVILNIKEAGIEEVVLSEVRKRQISEFFLLDVEFPYIYRAARAGERAIAMRYSEDESICTVLNYKGMVDWVWIDTNTRLPLDEDIVNQLQGFKTCLVCPERWNRPADIRHYKQRIRDLHMDLTAVMTSEAYVDAWR